MSKISYGFPGDNWRFYYDFGQALVYWASKKMHPEETVYPVKVVETNFPGLTS